MKRVSFLLITYFFVACSSPNKIPEDIIGINKMKLIVWDLTRAGKFSQIEYEKGHRIYFAEGRPLRKDTLLKKNKHFVDNIPHKKDSSSSSKKDTLSYKLLATQAFQQVFDLYHITKEEFYKSYRYYEEHPDKNSILMDSLSAFAGRQRQELYIKTK
jgi:hypothetical protein